MAARHDDIRWDAATVTQLRALWPIYSPAEIARKMGITKGAVDGKARRLELPAKPPPPKKQYPPSGSGRKKVGKTTLPNLKCLEPT